MENLRIGQSASIERSFTKEDVIAFTKLSMDTNPEQLDEEYAKTTVFKDNIVHGFLVGSLISAVIGTMLPGPGSIYLHQEMDFRRPVYIGESVKATVTVESIRTDKPIIRLSTKCMNDRHEEVIDGFAVIKIQ